MKPKLLGALAVLAMGVALWAAFVYAPTEQTMGEVQRIFYFHVSSAAWGFISAFVTGIASVMFLATNNLKWDRLASSAAEMVVLFAGLCIAMGMIWAKPIWGIWWTFDARLTLQLVLWLIYCAYLMLRAYIPDPVKRATLCSVFGILGAIDVPINYMSIRWWRTQHPAPVIAGGPDSGLDPQMTIALLIVMAAFGFLYAYLLNRRMTLAKIHDEVEYLETMVHAQ